VSDEQYVLGLRIKKLEALLDNYRGTCDRCGAAGVLLVTVDEGVAACLDEGACNARFEEVVLPARQAAVRARKERIENGTATPHDRMIDYYRRQMLRNVGLRKMAHAEYGLPLKGEDAG
jgi:hypothetical protein